MSKNHFCGATGLALAVAAVVGAGALVQAQQDESQDQGRVVQIGRADEESNPSVPPPGRDANAEEGVTAQQQELPRYWIGLLGGSIVDDHPLRAHLDLPAGQGLLVADVVPDSPAAKAGLKKHDILLRANETELKEMADLVGLVRTEGEKKGQITLEVLRGGERETIYITPEQRPADAQLPQEGGFGEGGFEGGVGLPEGFNELFGQLQRGQRPFNFRNFGPGVIVQPDGMPNIPNGVSVSIEKHEGQPTHITVKRGDETWKVVGDDPDSLKKLPDDLRPFVERMLRGGLTQQIEIPMPNMEEFRGRFGDDRLQERLEQMEQRMEELQRRLLGPTGQQTDEPNAEADGANGKQ